jgi:outer membrane protein
MSYKLQVSNYHHVNTSSRHFIRFLFSAFCFLFIFHASAQSKFGHVDYGEIMKNMKGIDSIQILVKEYEIELQTIGEQMLKEFQEKQTAFEQLKNSSNTSPAILKIKQDDLVAMYKRIQEFSQSAEIDLRDKQLELLEPFRNKLEETIKKVAKANNYNYVFDITILLFHSPNDNLTDKIKMELGIK